MTTQNNQAQAVEQLGVQAAIILPVGFNEARRAIDQAIVTVKNGKIVVSYFDDTRFGIAVTPDQWRQVVKFVEGQLNPAQPELTVDESWKPDWAQIDSEWSHYAVDRNLTAFFYDGKPDLDTKDGQWWHGPNATSNLHARVGKVELPDNVKWTDTLCVRPGL